MSDAIKRYAECPRCGRLVRGEEHHVRLTLVGAPPNAPETDLEGVFHHACAAEVFHQFRGRTRGEPLRQEARDV